MADAAAAALRAPAHDGQHALVVLAENEHLALAWHNARVDVPWPELRALSLREPSPRQAAALAFPGLGYAAWSALLDGFGEPLLAAAWLIIGVLALGGVLRPRARFTVVHARGRHILRVALQDIPAARALVTSVATAHPAVKTRETSVVGVVTSSARDAFTASPRLSADLQARLGRPFRDDAERATALRIQRRMARWITAWTVGLPLLACAALPWVFPATHAFSAVMRSALLFPVLAVTGLAVQSALLGRIRPWLEKA